jgi:predicted ATP-dependent serine protease
MLKIKNPRISCSQCGTFFSGMAIKCPSCGTYVNITTQKLVNKHLKKSEEFENTVVKVEKKFSRYDLALGRNK